MVPTIPWMFLACPAYLCVVPADRPQLTAMYSALYDQAGVDIIMTPMTAIPTTPISATEPYTLFKGQYLLNRQLLRVTSVVEPEIGAPGLNLPVGLGDTQLPVGLQIQARPGMCEHHPLQCCVCILAETNGLQSANLARRCFKNCQCSSKSVHLLYTCGEVNVQIPDMCGIFCQVYQLCGCCKLPSICGISGVFQPHKTCGCSILVACDPQSLTQAL